ncbi:hypothetical protein GCM10009759_13050 [Kitasatospora saccharophila]|uniref:Uncharacterized protein n=1 Tax=Kitasatospora saccharophila TaxID=407973 RepID=A0ABN2WDK2_9ACTN
MTLNGKGTRPITVDGVSYRWRVRHRPSYMQAVGQTPLTAAVERAERTGSVLLLRFPHAHPGNWLGLPGTAVTPARIAAAVRLARARGWDPERRTEPFRLDLAPEP